VRVVQQLLSYLLFATLLIGVGLAAVAWSILHLIAGEEP
jgi:hypothetical protein